MGEIKEITEKMMAFRDERDWKQFHNHKDVAMSLVLEAAEVLEHFQWKSAQEVEAHGESARQELADELADVAWYLFELAHDLKIEKKLVDRSTDKGGLAKGKVVKYYSYEITVEILSDAARKNELVLMDKMPYSDSELVKVNGPTGLQYQPDETKLGVMKFRLKLADAEKKFKIAYKYEVSYDKDVILDTSLL